MFILTFEYVSFVIRPSENGVDFSVASAKFTVASAFIVEGHRRRRPSTQEGPETGFSGRGHILTLPVQLLNETEKFPKIR